MKSKWLYMGMAGVLAASLMTGCGKATETSTEEGATTAVTAEEIKPIAVSVTQIGEGTLSSTDKILGEISANTNISILSKVPGTLVELSVKKGDRVKNGQVIGRLDQTDYLLAVKQAEAQLGYAQANLNQAQSVNGINVAGSSYDLAKRAGELAQANYDRTKALVDSGAAPASQLEQVETALIQAKTQLNQAAKGDANSTATIEVAKAGVKQAQVGVEMAKSTLKDTMVKATADGIITDVMVEVGDAVGPQMPIASLINFDPAIVKVNVTETNLAKFNKGSELDLFVPSQGKNLKGKVTYVGFEASAQSKMFPVELQIANADLSILPGMKVDVMVKDLAGKKGVLVPTEAILEVDGKKIVYVVESDQATKREVVLSEGNSTHVIAESGLNAGEKVVVKGHSQLKDQAKVRVVE